MFPRRYRVIKALGRGGQGTVWLAEDRYREQRPVAVKVVPFQDAQDDGLRRLRQEFLTLRRLSHPNIARVRDFGTVRLPGIALAGPQDCEAKDFEVGGPSASEIRSPSTSENQAAYFTSDFIQGGSLLEWVSGSPGEADWRSFLSLAFQALSALNYVSRHGIRHGDIKPSNLLLQSSADEGNRLELKLIDFGLANLQSEIAGDFGTPVYAAPPGALREGPDGDLYSLGMTLFHAASGHLPFALGDPDALAGWWSAGNPARLSEHEPSAPPGLCELVRRLTSQDATKRFRSPAEALEFLKGKFGEPAALGRYHEPPEHLIAYAWGDVLEEAAAEVALFANSTGADGGKRRPLRCIALPDGQDAADVVEFLSARLTVQGVRCVHFEHLEDARAEQELCDLAEELSGQDLPRTTEAHSRALEISSRLAGHPVCLLLEDTRPGDGVLADGVLAEGAAKGPNSPEERPTDALLPALRPFLRAQGFSQPALVVLSDNTVALQESWRLDSDEILLVPLEPMSEEAVAEAACDGLGAASVPPTLVDRIAEESGGRPARVQQALQVLVEAGVVCDFLGELVLPKDLPERLTESPKLEERSRRLPPGLRAALTFLLAADEPLSAIEATTRSQELLGGPSPGRGTSQGPWAHLPATEPAWGAAFEELRRRGFLRRTTPASNNRVRLAEAPERGLLAAVLGEDSERSCREALSRSRRSGALGSREQAADALAAAARNELALGKAYAAWRAGLKACRAFQQERRGRDAANVCRALLAGEADLDGQARLRFAFKLRAAAVFADRGEPDSALEALENAGNAEPTWYRWRAEKLRGALREQLGDREGALLHLEGLEELAAAESIHPVERLSVHARLVPLYFSSGRADRGRAALVAGRHLLEQIDDWVLAADRGYQVARAARVLGLFGSSEAVHGDAGIAIEQLEKALELARRCGRRDLEQDPLNDLGILHAQKRNWTDALRVFEQTERLASDRGDRMAMLRALYNRALTHYRLDELDAAESLFQQARRVSESLGRHSLSATVWLGLAGVLRERERFVESLRLYRRVLRLPGAFARPYDLAVSRNNLAELYLSLGRLDRALHSAREGHRIATATESRFLIGLTARILAKALWALGAKEAAIAGFEDAAHTAQVDDDRRGLGVAWLHLGRLASASGDVQGAFSSYRLGIAHSRAASDVLHRDAGLLGVLHELLARGRRGFARRSLLRRPAVGGWGRHRLFAEVLEIRVGSEWPRNWEQARRLLVGGSTDGRLWDAFSALGEVLRDPLLPPTAAAELTYDYRRLAYRLARKIPDEFGDAFLAFWKADTPASDAAEVSPPSVLHPAAVQAPPSPAARERVAATETRFLEIVSTALASDGSVWTLEQFLEAGLEALGASSVGIFFDPSQDPVPFLFVGRRADQQHPAEGIPIAAIEQSRSAPQPQVSGTLVLTALPHPIARRVACVEFAAQRGAATSTSPPADRGAEVSRLGAVLALVLRQGDMESALRQERQRHEQTRDEIRLLHTRASRSNTELETAFMTQRLELLELRTASTKSGAVGGAAPRALIGKSSVMQKVLKRLRTVAASSLPVLILGESGVGKDLVAQWIHRLSPRGRRPYLPEICNLPEALAETELFGFVRGAFTDAVADRPGLFQLADGGTIYLDEIAALPASMQARLLRVLEEKAVRPIGADAPIAVDFRLVSSSRRPYEELESDSTLRRDLLFRVNTEILEVPPLRDRKEDIPLLVRHFIEEWAELTGKEPAYVQDSTFDKLLEHTWPGNVRELENELQRALAENSVELPPDAVLRQLDRRDGSRPQRSLDALPTLQEHRRCAEHALLTEALELCAGNATAAARHLGVTRRYLGTLIEKHAIKLSDFKRK